MNNNLKKTIKKIIKKHVFISKNYNTEELISISLYFILKKPYFNNMYDFLYIRRNHNNRIRLVTPYLNNVAGAINNSVIDMVCSTSEKTAEAETRFFLPFDCDFLDYDDNYLEILNNIEENNIFYLEDKVIKNILIIKKMFSVSKDFDSLKLNMDKILKKDQTIVFDFFTHFHELSKNAVFKELYKRVTIDSNESLEHGYKLSFKNKGTINRLYKNEIYDFEEEKNKILKKITKKLKRINSIKTLVTKDYNDKFIFHEILNEVQKEYPLLSKNISSKNIKELDFYIIKYFKEEQNDNWNFPSNIKYVSPESRLQFMLGTIFEMNEVQVRSSSSLSGMVYADKNLINYEEDSFFIIAKDKMNETVGILSLRKKSYQNNIFNIGEISIKKNYRNKGLAKQMYSRLAEFCIINDIVITNSVYSKEGLMYLPKMKQKLKQKYPDFLLIDKNIGNIHNNIDLTNVIENYNAFVINHILPLDQEKKISSKALLKSYNAGLKYLFKNNPNGYRENLTLAKKYYEKSYKKLSRKNWLF